MYILSRTPLSMWQWACWCSWWAGNNRIFIDSSPSYSSGSCQQTNWDNSEGLTSLPSLVLKNVIKRGAGRVSAMHSLAYRPLPAPYYRYLKTLRWNLQKRGEHLWHYPHCNDSPWLLLLSHPNLMMKDETFVLV